MPLPSLLNIVITDVLSLLGNCLINFKQTIGDQHV